MLSNIILQLLCHSLRFLRRGIRVSDLPEFSKDIDHSLMDFQVIFFCSAFGFLFIFLIGRRCAPGSFCLRGILINFSCIKCVKCQLFHPYRFDADRKIDQVFNVFFLKLQEFDLLAKRFTPVKIRTADDFLNIFQRKLQFSEKKDLLQGLQAASSYSR